MPTLEQEVKRARISVEIVKGRSSDDDKLWALKNDDSVNLSHVFRQGALLWIAKQSGRAGFEADVLNSLDEIKDMLSNGASAAPKPQQKQKFGNPFLDSEL